MLQEGHSKKHALLCNTAKKPFIRSTSFPRQIRNTLPESVCSIEHGKNNHWVRSSHNPPGSVRNLWGNFVLCIFVFIQLNSVIS